ncbi:MAG: PhzF family phenazine biosynthesis protein [Actinomycetota bacterium]|nr:PhzF family phenazine biosynthesis protein [Actinomycetota bacterium]
MRIFQVDAFTTEPFRGNPAAVCLVDEPCDDQWMQAVGAEMNLAETAFLEPRADGFGLRWFSPTIEVDLCGHATLASAHVLWELGQAQDCLRFHTRSGLLTADRVDGAIQLDFPSQPAEPIEAPADLAEALGVTPRWVGRSSSDYLVEVADAATLRAMQPDFATMAAWPVRGTIVTAAGSATAGSPDFLSRFFAPGTGIDEDQVTGSSHCCLGPFWAARLGKDTLVGYQASRRGGTVGVRVAGDRVVLAGQAVTVLRGELF